MFIIKAPATAEITVKKSRFVTDIMPLYDADSAKQIWRNQKLRYDNGGHIVYAFSVGPQGNISGCSDDGEPAGTAGRPVLAVLQGAQLTNTIITVTRYFGGIKLGTGGLVRAYTDSAKSVLEAAELLPLIPMSTLSWRFAYKYYNSVARVFAEYGFNTGSENFGETVTITGTLPSEKVENLKKTIADLTCGEAIFAFADAGRHGD